MTIFISYARADGSKFANEVHNQLTASKHDVWLDVYNIPKGADWNNEIDKALPNATAVLVILTPGSTLSDQVTSEWNFASNHYIPIIPLLFIPCEVPRLLMIYNYVDFTSNAETQFIELQLRLDTLAENHLKYLRQRLDKFKHAQEQSDDPNTFKSRIDQLEEAIIIWQRRIEQEQQKHVVKVAGERYSLILDNFKDRTNEQQTLRNYLVDENTRLVSVIGRGGIGKTALVTKILSEMEQTEWSRQSNHTPVDGIIYLSARSTDLSVFRIFMECLKFLVEILPIAYNNYGKIHILRYAINFSNCSKLLKMATMFSCWITLRMFWIKKVISPILS